MYLNVKCFYSFPNISMLKHTYEKNCSSTQQAYDIGGTKIYPTRAVAKNKVLWNTSYSSTARLHMTSNVI